MAAPIGQLFVDFAANTSAFTRDLGKVRKDMNSFQVTTNRALAKVNKAFGTFGNKVKSALKGIFSLRGAITTLAGSAGIGLLVNKSVELANNIAKTADAIGLTTTRLQEYRFAANQAGVNTALFDSSMTAFVKRVGEAQAGVGPLVSGLKNLNPTLLENLKNTQNQEEAFKLMADAVKNAKSDTEAAALANAAFSRSGIAMVNVLRDGREGLDNMSKIAQRFGLVLDESLIRKSEIASDQFGILGQILKVKVAEAVLQNIDAIIDFANSVIKNIPKVVKVIKGIGSIFGWVGDKVMAFKAGYIGMVNGIKKWSFTIIKTLEAWAKGFAAAFAHPVRILKEFGKDLGDFISNPFLEQNRDFSRLNAVLEDGFTGAFRTAFGEVKQEAIEFAKQMDKETADAVDKMVKDSLPEAREATLESFGLIKKTAKNTFTEISEGSSDAFGKVADNAVRAAKTVSSAAGTMEGSFINAFSSLRAGQGVSAGDAGGILSSVGGILSGGFDPMSLATSVLGSSSAISGGLLALGSGGIPLGGFGAASMLAGAAPFIGPALALAAPLIGGLFGGKSSDISNFAGVLGEGGGFSQFSSASKNIGTEFAEGLGEQLGNFLDAMSAITGVSFGGLGVFGGSHSKKGTSIRTDFNAGVGETSFFFDPENQNSMLAAFKGLSEVLVDAAGASEELKERLQSVTTEGKTTEKFFAELDSVVNAEKNRQAFLDALKLRTLSVTDPNAFRMQQLEGEFDAIRSEAERLGVDMLHIERAFAAERKQLLESFSSTTSDSLKKDVEAFRSSLLLDPSIGGLSVQARRNEALKQFESTKAAFRSGGAGFDDVQRASTNLLEASKDWFGLSEDFYREQAQVLSFLDEIESNADNQLDANEEIIGQLETLNFTFDEFRVQQSGESELQLELLDAVKNLLNKLQKKITIAA